MAETTYTIASRPPVRAFLVAAVCSLLGAGAIVLAASGGWKLVWDVVLTILGVLLLIVGLALMGLAWWTMRRMSVTLTLDDTGFRLRGGEQLRRGEWLDVMQVTRSEDGSHVTIYHGPERRTHLLFDRTDQVDAVLDDMTRRLKRSRA